MILNKTSIQRLVIFFFYDADGVVDRYITYMLEDIKKNCTELFVICNGKLTPEGRNRFNELTPHLMVRENEGFDVWAYKTALEHYGWEKLSAFDEVVLMNFTMFGPLYPFSEMFSAMNKRDVDFWGITKHHGFPFDPFGTIPYGYIPEHIQSSFICVRKPMMNSQEFHDYWENMDAVHSYGEAVGKHEAIFTKRFTDYGFRSDVYVQTDDLIEYTHYPLMLMPTELVKNRRCPVIKRKSFTNEYYEFLDACLGEPTVELYEYIKNNLDYDLDMIWENLLRTDNMADIKNRMHLNYILPKRYVNDEKTAKSMKIALVMHIYYDDEVDNCFQYAKSMPSNADVFFTTCKDDTFEHLVKRVQELKPRRTKVLKIENRGRDVSSLLVGTSPYVFDYDLVCFAHDKKTRQNKPYTVGMSFAYKCLENTLGSEAYVKNVISRFAAEPKLGMMIPPPPNHSNFYGILGTEWGSNYQNTVQLAKEMGIKADINENKEPITPLGTMFWFRPDALKPLYSKKWKYEDFPEEPNRYDGTLLHAIERIYGFCAQSQGYYTAWCMNDEFAAIEMTNYHFMLRELSQSMYAKVGFTDNFNMMKYRFEMSSINNNTRIVLKNAIKKRIPKPIWTASRKIYRLFGGKKWIG